MKSRVLVNGQLSEPGAEPRLGEESQDGRVTSTGSHVDGRVLLPVQDIDVSSLDNKWLLKCSHL